MKTAAMLAILILGTCFYMSTAVPVARQTEVYNQVAKAADFDDPDPCLLCNLLVQHICKENYTIIATIKAASNFSS